MNNILKQICVFMLCAVMAAGFMSVNAWAAKKNCPKDGNELTYYKANDATDTKDGNIAYYTCSTCNKYFSENLVETSYDAVIVHYTVTDAAVAATCTTDGKTEGSHCSVCGTVITAQETIPAGHTVVTDAAVAATCTTAGKTEGSHCSVCGTVITAQETIPATGHDLTSVAQAATCTEAGIKESYKCSKENCGMYFEDANAKTEIVDWDAWKSDPNGGLIPKLAKPAKVSVDKASYTYNGKSQQPKVTVTDADGKTIDSTYYTVSVSPDTTNAGSKTITVKFTKNYKDCEDMTATYVIYPKSEITVTLGKSIKTTDIGASSGKFVIDSKYKKGNYKFKLSSNDKTITTYTYAQKKINYSKLPKSIKIKWQSGDNKITRPITVKFKLPDAKITIKKKKISGGYGINFKYDFTNASSVKIRLKGFNKVNKNWDNYTKKHKKTNKLYSTFKKATCKKFKNKMIFTVTVKYKNGLQQKWTSKTYSVK